MRYALVVVAAGALLCGADASTSAQSVAARVSPVRDGTVRLTFASRPGVCGDGSGNVWVRGRLDRGNDTRMCIAGPVRVAVGRADGQTVSIREYVGGRWGSPSGETDLGDVSAVDAVRYLMTLAHTMGGRSGDAALSAAALADGGDLAPELRLVVRDDGAPISSRKQALFWLGQSELATRDLVQMYATLGPTKLREHFTFVLSQRRDDESLSKLIDVAQHDRDAQVRKQAMFWLGQSDDPRATKFFRDLLTP